MSSNKVFRVVLFFTLFLFGSAISCLDAQNRQRNNAQQYFRRFQNRNAYDPQKFFRQFFGEETDEDRKRLERIEVSAREETKFGNQAAKAYLKSLKDRNIDVVSKGEEVDYLRELVKTIQPYMKNAKRYRNIRVHLVKSPKFDARSFPGGTLVFYEGVFDFAENEAALVGIVGHELSHLDHGHQLINIKKMKLSEQLFTGKQGFRFDNFMQAGQSMMKMWSRPYRPEDERQADRDGATWAFKAGYDSREMAKLFLRFQQKNGNTNVATNQLPDFFRSHPANRSRYKDVMALFDSLKKEDARKTRKKSSGKTKPLYLGRENLKRRIPRSKQQFPD